MALSDTVKGWGKELGETVKRNSAFPKSTKKKKELSKKIAIKKYPVNSKMLNKDEEGRRVPDADKNSND